MRRTIISALFMLYLTLTSGEGSDDASTTAPSCDHQKPISEVINSMSYRLAREIGGKDNYFFSPFSISVALAMIYLGAQGTTKHQMTVALRYRAAATQPAGCVGHEISKGFKDLMESLESDGEHYKFMVANGVFVQRGYSVISDFISQLKKFFNAKIGWLDFRNEEREAMKAVNAWVSNSTNGQIAKLLNDPLDPMTIMILLNAVYFKGLWYLPFDQRHTWQAFFYYPNETSKITSFMGMEEQVNYYHDAENGYSYLELEYVGHDISMLVALPENSKAFPDVDLSSETLCRVRSKLAPTNVIVVLPKFKLEYKRELSKIMINMGMGELFSDRADLTGIRSEKDLHVSLMIHKAIIEVNEQGSEASAVSGVGIDGRNRRKRATFWADHAFVFCILDKRSDAILFTGRVADPDDKF